MTNLVEIRNPNIRFTGERTMHAVNDLSLRLGEGEVLGLLGESGSGKSVTLRALMRRAMPDKGLVSQLPYTQNPGRPNARSGRDLPPAWADAD